MKTRITSFRINDDVHDKLKAYCERHGIKLGFFVNQAITERLREALVAEAMALEKEAAHG